MKIVYVCYVVNSYQGKRIKIVDLNPIFHRKRTNHVSPTLSGQAIQSRKAWNPRPKAEDSIIKPSGYALGFHANAANDMKCRYPKIASEAGLTPLNDTLSGEEHAF